MARHPWVRNAQYPDTWTAVYRLFDAADRLLYVGIAYDFLARWKQHRRQKHWWPQVARKDVIWYDNRFDAAWEESRAIRDENPIHNDHPGLSPVGMIVFERWSGWPRYRFEPVANPHVVFSEYDTAEVLRQVMAGRVRALMAYEGEVAGAVLSWSEYKRANVAMGIATPEQFEDQMATLLAQST